MGGGVAPDKDTKTVVVLGAAYGGAHAAQLIAAGLPKGWKVVLIDRNSHANHVYVMPRFAVLPGHEYKAFIPYTKVFLTNPKPEHIHLQAHIINIRPHNITLSQSFPELGFPTPIIPFDFAIYALGSQLPAPLNLWGTSADGKPTPRKTLGGSAVYKGEKSEGCQWLMEKQKVIEDAPTILVVGGGALGIQFATDIKSVFPSKIVTLLHSRLRLLPRFDEKMHNEIFNACQNLGVKVILGERLDLSSIEDDKAKMNQLGQKVVRTVTGREISADLLLLCTGQMPNTGLIKEMDPAVVNESNQLVRVLRTLQLHASRFPSSGPGDSATIIGNLQKLSVTDAGANDTVEKESEDKTPYSHIFAIGDAADAFGAIAAGHTAYAQGEVAARNVLRLIKRQQVEEELNITASTASEVQNHNCIKKPELEALEHYTPGPPGIKVSLGLNRAVYQMGRLFGVKEDGKSDLEAAAIWPFFGIKVEKDEDMRA